MNNSAEPALSADYPPPALALSWLAAALPGLYLLLTSTTTLIPGIWPYDAKRMLEFGLLFLLFLLPAVSRRIRSELGATLAAVPRWVGVTLLAVFAWGAVSALVNARSPMQLANSLSEVALFSSLVLGTFIIASCRHVGGRAFDRIAIGLLALTGLAVGVQELLGVAAAHAAGVDFNFRISLLHFSWPRFYNQVQSWTVPVIAALPLLFSRYPLARVLCVIVLALHWYIILMTGARGSFVALSAAMVFAVVFLPPPRKPLLQWQLAGLALGALIFAAVLFSFETESTPASQPTNSERFTREGGPQPTVGHYGNENEGTSGFLAQSLLRPMLSTMGRTWMWKVSLRDAGQNPVFGIGPMNYVCTSPEFIGHPHNFPLQIAAEWGIPAALAICTLVTVLLWRVARYLRSPGLGSAEDWVLAGLLLTGVLAAALHACVSGVMVMPASQVTGMLICGLLLGLTPVVMREQAHYKQAWLFVPGLLLSAGLIVLGVQELRTMPERSAQMRPGEDMRPRIWQDAKVCRLYIPQDQVTK